MPTANELPDESNFTPLVEEPYYSKKMAETYYNKKPPAILPRGLAFAMSRPRKWCLIWEDDSETEAENIRQKLVRWHNREEWWFTKSYRDSTGKTGVYARYVGNKFPASSEGPKSVDFRPRMTPPSHRRGVPYRDWSFELGVVREAGGDWVEMDTFSSNGEVYKLLHKMRDGYGQQFDFKLAPGEDDNKKLLLGRLKSGDGEAAVERGPAAISPPTPAPAANVSTRERKEDGRLKRGGPARDFSPEMRKVRAANGKWTKVEEYSGHNGAGHTHYKLVRDYGDEFEIRVSSSHELVSKRGNVAVLARWKGGDK